jgi:hypothetical protein
MVSMTRELCSLARICLLLLPTSFFVLALKVLHFASFLGEAFDDLDAGEPFLQAHGNV